jgi:hypothetical protein
LRRGANAVELVLEALHTREMADLSHYRFTSTWRVDASPHEAFEVLRNLMDYPAWWPEVRQMWELEDGVVQARCRSLLPYELWFTMRRTREDRDALVLEAAMEGDLEGFSRWTISPSGSGSRLLFEEEVTTHKKVLNRLAWIARPAFKANHTLVMRHGESGLRTYLPGFRRARELAVEH